MLSLVDYLSENVDIRTLPPPPSHLRSGCQCHRATKCFSNTKRKYLVVQPSPNPIFRTPHPLPLADSSLERRLLPMSMSRRLAWLASESGLLQVPPTVFTRFSKITCKTHTTTGLGVVNTGNVRARSLLLPGRRLRAVPVDNIIIGKYRLTRPTTRGQ